MVLYYQLEKQKRQSGAPLALLMKRFLTPSSTEHLFPCSLNSIRVWNVTSKKKSG